MTVTVLYKNRDSAGPGYLYVADPFDYSVFKDKKFSPLPSLEEKLKSEFLLSYKQIISQTIVWNKYNKFFRSTPFAIRNTWQSHFYQGYESYFRLKILKEGFVYFNSAEWFLWVCQNLSVKFSDEDIRKARKDLWLKKIEFLKNIYNGLRFAFSKRSGHAKIDPNTDFVICTVWTKQAEELWNRNASESFYGSLLRDLKERRYNVSVVYHPEGQRKTSIACKLIPASAFANFLKFSDWVKIAWRILYFPVFFMSGLNAPQNVILRDISNSLTAQIPYALITYYALKRILLTCPSAKIVSLYENNCWETGVIMAAQENGRSVTAFQHTAYSPSFLKMNADIEEKILPNRIFTSGPESSRLMMEAMRHSSPKIYTGCALRYKHGHEPVAKIEAGKILVLLQGAPTDSLLIRILKEYFSDQNLRIRCHPAWPLDDVRPFEVSSNVDIKDDLKQSSLVLYDGTTAVFEALNAGVPAVYLNIGKTLSSDPLFSMVSCPVKREWKIGDNFENIVMEINSLSENQLDAAFQRANDYIKDYFRPADRQSVDALIEVLVNE